MTKPLMKYVPQKYYSSIRDFYKDSEGYWLCDTSKELKL